MKLTNLHHGFESLDEDLFTRWMKNMSPLLASMPASKRNHSRRVAKRLRKAGVGKAGVHAGFAHDYLERGGTVDNLFHHASRLGLSPRVIKIVQVLTSDEKADAENYPGNQPLDHLMQVLADPDLQSDQKTKNLVLLVKLSDRLDNLRKRLERAGKIGNQYRQKSLAIVQFVASHYTGKAGPYLWLHNKLMKLLVKK